jgi:hypothetical protein
MLVRTIWRSVWLLKIGIVEVADGVCSAVLQVPTQCNSPLPPWAEVVGVTKAAAAKTIAAKIVKTFRFMASSLASETSHWQALRQMGPKGCTERLARLKAGGPQRHDFEPQADSPQESCPEDYADTTAGPLECQPPKLFSFGDDAVFSEILAPTFSCYRSCHMQIFKYCYA